MRSIVTVFASTWNAIVTRPLEPDDAQAGPDIVPPMSSLPGQFESTAEGFDAFDVTDRAESAEVGGDMVVKCVEIAERFRREDDPTLFHVAMP